MGFFSSMIGSVVKVAITPVAIAADVVKVATGNDADTTKNLIQSSVEDVQDAMDSLTDGDL